MEPTSSRHGSGKSLLDGFEQGSFEVSIDEDRTEFWKQFGQSIEYFLVQPVWLAGHQDMENWQNNSFVRDEDVEHLSEGTRCSLECAISKNVSTVVIQDRQKYRTCEYESHMPHTLMYALNIASVTLFRGASSFIVTFESV